MIVVVYRQDRRRRVTLVLLILTSLALITLDERGSGLINSARTAAQDIVAPVQDLVDNVVSPVTDFFDNIGRAGRLEDENRGLRRELAQARTEVAGDSIARARNKELEQLLDLPECRGLRRRGRERRRVGPGTSRARSGSTREARRESAGACLSSSAARWLGGSRRFPGGARSCSASTTGASGSGSNSSKEGQKVGPVGIATGRANSTSAAAQISVDSTNTETAAVTKGELAVTTGMPFAGSFPKGLPVGYVVKTVTSGGAVPQDSALSTVVDLNRLDVVKVLRYPSRSNGSNP